MEISELQWADPPVNQRGRSAGKKHLSKEFLAALKERPGEWAIWPGSKSSLANYLGKHPEVAQDYQTAYRSAGSDHTVLYARYWMP